MNPEQINSWTSWLMNLGAAPFTVVAVIAVGYFLRLIPKFPNDWIPPVCPVLGMIIYPILAHHHTDETMSAFVVRTIFAGLIIGLGAWAFHNKILNLFEDKIPILGQLISAAQKVDSHRDTEGTEAAVSKVD